MGSSTNGSTVPINGQTSPAGSIFVEVLKPFQFKIPSGELALIHYRMQEIEFDGARSSCQFRSSGKKPFLVTPGAQDAVGEELALECLTRLCALAKFHAGIDYLQKFEIIESGIVIWFIEDGDGGAITALLPSEY